MFVDVADMTFFDDVFTLKWTVDIQSLQLKFFSFDVLIELT